MKEWVDASWNAAAFRLYLLHILCLARFIFRIRSLKRISSTREASQPIGAAGFAVTGRRDLSRFPGQYRVSNSRSKDISRIGQRSRAGRFICIDPGRNANVKASCIARQSSWIASCASPPEIDRVRAQRALSQAQTSQAEIYASASFKAGRSELERAETEMVIQLSRPRPFRQFSRHNAGFTEPMKPFGPLLSKA